MKRPQIFPIRSRGRKGRGASLTEYGMLAGLVSVAAIGAIVALGGNVRDVSDNTSAALSDLGGGTIGVNQNGTVYMAKYAERSIHRTSSMAQSVTQIWRQAYTPSNAIKEFTSQRLGSDEVVASNTISSNYSSYPVHSTWPAY